MELSGNMCERAADVSRGRGFEGTHGDGVLSSVGGFTRSDWSGLHGYRANQWRSTEARFRVSDRRDAASDNNARMSPRHGFRAVRSAGLP